MILNFITPRVPFDMKNPLGFLMALTMQGTMFCYGMTVGSYVLALAAGAYSYGIALSKCIKGSLFCINRSTLAKIDQSILLEQFAEFIDLHSSTEQLSENVVYFNENSAVIWLFEPTHVLFSRLISSFSGFIQHFITVVFAWSLVTICGAMLMIQIQLVH